MTDRTPRGRIRRLAGSTAAGVALTALVMSVVPAGATVPDKSVTATFDCTISVLTISETYLTPLTVSATAPATAAPGAAVKLTGVQTVLKVPASFVNLAIGYGATSFSGSVTKAAIHATDAKPATVNAAGKGVTIPTTKLVSNKGVTVKVPASPATVGPWTAKGKGTMTFSTGGLAATLTVTTTTYGKVSASLLCSPRPVAVLATTAVS